MPQETKKKETKKSPKVAKKGAVETPERLRIKVQAYEYKILDNSVRQIIDTAVRYDAKVRGPIPLPTDTKKYTVNRSSFVYKDAREQYEMRTHRRLIDILEPSGKVIEALTNLSLPSGISIDVKMI
ncbi:MAG: 30S ribosomal protein S10 [Candidatus Paceibacterota bacterium]